MAQVNDAHILIVDDDPDVRQAAVLALAPHAERCDEASDIATAAAMLSDGGYEALLFDMNFAAGARDGSAGLAGIATLRAADPTIGIVFITAYGGVALAVEAMKRGGDDFVLKPWRNAQLVAAAADAVRRSRDRRAIPTLDAVERAAIVSALEHHDGNIARAAAVLGLTRQALYRRLAKHG